MELAVVPVEVRSVDELTIGIRKFTSARPQSLKVEIYRPKKIKPIFSLS
ncbi:MAG: hypothetical protein PHP25_01685 [Candidatus Moranbacteria bacterium]|nr:hypothetical protein [Candidatus Moranbacteria bacterium]